MNREISKIFREMSLFFNMQDDVFRYRAYEKGAWILENLSRDAEEIYKKEGLKGLENLSGIGRGMAEKIEEYIKNGSIKEYKDLKKKMPVDIEELTGVESLGPKGVKILYKELGIKNLQDLERAAKAGKIRNLRGFGEKKEKNILEGIEFVKKNSEKMLLGYAWPKAQNLIEEFRGMKEVIEISPAGSLRRKCETVGDIDILIATESPEKIIKYFVNRPDVIKIWGTGPTKASVRVRDNFDIDLRVVSKESFGSALQYFTGSKAHNIKLRQIAIDKKLKLNEYGLFQSAERRGTKRGITRKEKMIAGATEDEIYRALGLEYMEPELREDTGEIELLLKKESLPDIIKYGSLQGDLQVQTDWTDGDHSIEEMAKEAKRLGRKYIAITDHTKSLAMTGGCDEKKLMRQMAEIDNLNKKISGIKILKGAEVDILKDGSLDIQDEALEKLDIVGVSVHSLLKMSKKDMTERILRAIQNPNVDILFHPTGRLLKKRDPYEVDMEQIIKTAVKTNTILEINAHPSRLDLKDEHIRMGVELGAKFVIDSDAHNKEHLKYLEFGIAQARRGWAEASDIINTLPLDEFMGKLT